MKNLKTLRTNRNMPTIIIPVSSKIITEAIERDSHKCMIADAIKRRIPKAQYITVDLQSVRFTDPDTKVRFIYFTPLTGQQALVKFDQGLPVKPFSITLKDGVQEPMGWKPKHTKSSRKHPRKYNTTGKRRKGFAKKERKFGLRNLE